MVRYVKPFISNQMRLYRVYRESSEKNRVYCPCIVIDDLVMSRDSNVDWECAYCEAMVPTSVYLCSGCQAPRSKASMACLVTFRGRLSQAGHLFGLTKEDEIEVHGGCCGNPEIAHPELMIVRLYQFEVVELSIPFLASANDNYVDCIVKVKCRAEFSFEKILEMD